MDRYLKGEVIGKGTYGVVVKATDKQTQRQVAIKKIRSKRRAEEGVDVTALREIKCLKELSHPHIVSLIEVFTRKSNIYLVFEFMTSDLEAVIKDATIPLKRSDVKAYLQMTLKAVAHCHKCWVLHRDLKPNNLLIAPDGGLKLCDFGLARFYGSPGRDFTVQVFQRWYRAPELLFGSKQYSCAVDVWAAGCIFAELMLRRPMFQGSSDIDQLGKIFALLGTPTEEQWPGLRSLPDYVEYMPNEAADLHQAFPDATEDALNLLKCMLVFDPQRRITAQKALEHRYFKTSPAPTTLESLPRVVTALKPNKAPSPGTIGYLADHLDAAAMPAQLPKRQRKHQLLFRSPSECSSDDEMEAKRARPSGADNPDPDGIC